MSIPYFRHVRPRPNIRIHLRNGKWTWSLIDWNIKTPIPLRESAATYCVMRNLDEDRLYGRARHVEF